MLLTSSDALDDAEEIVETSFQLEDLLELNLEPQHIHTSTKRYKCPQCDYSATRSNTVKVHVSAVHEKIRNLRCPQCHYTSARRGDLNRHVRMVHEHMRKS